MKVGAVMIKERVVVQRPVVVFKNTSFEEAEKIILNEAIKTEDVELIGAVCLILETLKRRRNARN